jgi:hypothetical protein
MDNKLLINGNNVISLSFIENEDDLKGRPGMNINPPPEDGRCQCCGRHISELAPFGKAGDPLVGDFEGALLIKKFRAEGPYDEEAEKAFAEAEEHSDPEKFLQAKYGEEKGSQIYWLVHLAHSTRSSWECRECVCLDQNEYIEKYNESLK